MSNTNHSQQPERLVAMALKRQMHGGTFYYHRYNLYLALVPASKVERALQRGTQVRYVAERWVQVEDFAESKSFDARLRNLQAMADKINACDLTFADAEKTIMDRSW